MKSLVYEIEDPFHEGEDYSEIDRVLRVIRRDVTRYVKSTTPHRNIKRRPPPPDPHIYESFSKAAGPTVNRLAREYLTAILEKPKRRRSAPKDLPRVLPIFEGGPYAEVKEESSVCLIHDHWDTPTCSSFPDEELPVLFVNEGEEAPVETPATRKFYLRNSLRYGSPDGSHATTVCIIHPNDDYYRYTEEDIALGAAQFVQPSVVPSSPLAAAELVQPTADDGIATVENTPPLKEIKEEPMDEEEGIPLRQPVLPLNDKKNGELTRQKTPSKTKKKRSPTPTTPTLRLPKNIPEEDFVLPVEIFVDCGRAVPTEVADYWKRKVEEVVKTTRKGTRKRKLTSLQLARESSSPSPPPELDRVSKSSSPQLLKKAVDSSFDAMETDSDSKSETRAPSAAKEDKVQDVYAAELLEIYRAIPAGNVQAFHEEFKSRLIAAVLEQNNNSQTDEKMEVVYAPKDGPMQVVEEVAPSRETASLGSSSDSDTTTSPFSRESSHEKTSSADEPNPPKVPPLILRRFSMDKDLYPRYTLREGFTPQAQKRREPITSQL